MKKIEELTSQPKQRHTLLQENGEEIVFELEYKVSQQSWYYNVTKNDFVVNSQRLVLGPNIVRRYQNIINFGLYVKSNDLQEPFLLYDFISGRVEIYLLTQTECQDVETTFYSA